MQVLSLTRTGSAPELPLTKAPINFSVLRSDGLSSNRWGVDTHRLGDAYVYCRDSPQSEKISLHTSGRQHISITRDTARHIGVDDRFGAVWEAPEFEREAISTFSLLFPPWGVGVHYEPSKLTKDELLIVGHADKIVTVHFFVVDSSRKMKSQRPHFILGRLPLSTGKTLHIIAWKESQKDLMERVRRAVSSISSTLEEPKSDDDDYTVFLSGFRARNSAFMIAVPIQWSSRGWTIRCG